MTSEATPSQSNAQKKAKITPQDSHLTFYFLFSPPLQSVQIWGQTLTCREGKAQKPHPFSRQKWGLQWNLQCHGREKGGKGITLHFGSGCDQTLLPGALERSTEKMVSPSSPSWQRLPAAHSARDSAPRPFLMGCSFINCHHFHSPSCFLAFSLKQGGLEFPNSKFFFCLS